MKDNDTLYDLLKRKIKDNVDNANKLEDEKRKALMDSQYYEAKIRDRYNVRQMKAYYYYKYFITNILPMLIKEQIKTSYDLTMEEAKQKAFDWELQVTKQKHFDYEIQVSKNNEHIEQFMKYFNEFCISFGNYIVYKEFINYLNAFCLRNGIDITNEYRNSQVYNFDSMTIGDMLNAYYGELQRFEYTDELVAGIQEEENTNVNGEELIKFIKTR